MDHQKINNRNPHFHQAALASAFTLSIVSPMASLAAECETPVANPLVVNIATESEDPCDDQVSLREAIAYANGNLGKDTITFSDSLKGKTIEISTDKIDVFESVQIQGFENSSDLILQDVQTSRNRTFWIYSEPDPIDFEISGITWENSDNHDLAYFEGYGGDFIFDNITTTENTNARSLLGGFTGGLIGENRTKAADLNVTLKRSRITGSTFSGTMISLENGVSPLNIRIEDTEISNSDILGLVDIRGWYDSSIEINRTAIEGGNIGGKGSKILSSSSGDQDAIIVLTNTIIKDSLSISDVIINAQSDQTASISLDNTTISNNAVGAIINMSYDYDAAIPQDNLLTITSSHIKDNTIYADSAIHVNGNSGNTTIINSELSNNTAPESYAEQLIRVTNSNVHIDNSQVLNNELTPLIQISDNAINTTTLIENTVISGNSDGRLGGVAFWSEGTSLIDATISNSTISNSQGAAVLASTEESSSVALSIDNSTITNNHNSAYGGIVGGVGLYDNFDNADVSIENSIIAKNTSTDGDNDLYGKFTVQHSLIGDGTTNGSTTLNGSLISEIGNDNGQIPDTGNNLLGEDPLLQELSESGGTWVHQLTEDSPAIGAGNTSAENLPEFDQRGEGFTRIRNANSTPTLDMGAVQYFANPVAVNDSVSVDPNSTDNPIFVLSNDALNSNSLALEVGSITIMDHPENGTAESQQDGSILYTPSEDFIGTDTFTYVVQDIDGNTSTQGTVSVSVGATDEGGSSMNYWLLSLLGLFGLRRRK